MWGVKVKVCYVFELVAKKRVKIESNVLVCYLLFISNIRLIMTDFGDDWKTVGGKPKPAKQTFSQPTVQPFQKATNSATNSTASKTSGYETPKHIDDNTIVLRKKSTHVNPNAGQVRYGATKNTQHKSVNNMNQRKLADATDVDKLPTVGLSLGKLLQSHRIQMKKTQKELANMTRGKVTEIDIKEMEQGKAQPNQTKINALQLVLNVHLTGKKAGQMLRQPKS